jgi:hypothetical protein
MVFNEIPIHLKILSQSVKHLKSAFKNYHHLNSLYTSCEHCNSNIATQHSHNVQTGTADQTFCCSRGTWLWPLGETSKRVRLTNTLLNVVLGLSGATHLLPFMSTVWTGKAFTVLLFCHPTLRMAVKAVWDVGLPQGKSSLLNCCSNSRCLQLIWYSSWCSE